MTMCAPSTANHGGEQLTFLLAESPAKDSAEQGKGSENSTPETSGQTPSASSKKRAPRGSSLKTWQTSVRSIIGEQFSKTLRRQGMMLDGACSALETWVLPTFGSASGCSPQTPEPSAWPTPRCADGMLHPLRAPSNIQAGMDRQGRGSPCRLEDAVSMNRWPTPTATDAVLWATPTTRDHRSGKASAATHARNSRPLSEQVGNLLNPTWVEWLMGWPIDWTDPRGGPSSEDFRAWLESNRTALTDYVRSATVRYHSAEQSPGNCLVGRSDCPLPTTPHVEPLT